MTTKYFEPSAVHLFRYILASADMYYSEVEQRDVFLGKDEHSNLSIWGETAGAGSCTKINLCQVFLEYALYCCSSYSSAEAHCHMQNFGEYLGHSLAHSLRDDPAMLAAEHPEVRALEHVFGTIGACFSTEYSEDGVRFTVTNCPLENTAKRSGCPNVELAHYGVNAMCRGLVLDITPGATVHASTEIQSELVLHIKAPVVA